MPSITQDSRPITGVYVRGQLATGLYVGQKAIWPAAILGMSHLGVGSFALDGWPLLAETASSIRINPRVLTFTGAPLQSAISKALHVDLGLGAATFQGLGTAFAADAKPPLHAGTVALAGRGAAIVSGHVIPAITGSLHFAGQPLPKVSGNEVAAYISPDTLQFAPLAVTARAGAATAIAPDTFAFTGAAQAVAMGSALSVALHPSAVALTGKTFSVGAAAAVQIGADALAFTGAVLFPPADVVVSVLPQSVSIWGHYIEVDTSPYALRRVGARVTASTSSSDPTNVMLPPGAHEGDVAFIETIGPLTTPYGGPAGSTAIENQTLALYRYTLTAADALAGYVPMKVGITKPILVELFHDADPVPDAVGTYTTSTVGYPTSTVITVEGVTTTRMGAEPVVFLAATNAGSINTSSIIPSTWGEDWWSAGVGIARGPAQAPGSVGNVTWAYNYANTSSSSTRGALMLAVRPAIVNVFAELAPGALELPGATLSVPWTYPDVSLALSPDAIALPGALLVEPMDAPKVTFVGGNVVYNGQNEANGSSTQLPLPAGTQAGDYMFVNFGMNGLDPNDPPRVPPDSQLYRTFGEWFSLTVYWIPITAWDVANGYITIDPRRPCSFPYVVYHGADRYLQAVGDIVTPDPNVSQDGTLLVPGLPALQASGAAIIALTTTDAANADVVSGQGAWGVSAGAPWQVENATMALIQVGGGGLRSAVLWRSADVGASIPDTTVNEWVWSEFSDFTGAQMFAIRPYATDKAVNAVPSTLHIVGMQPAVDLKADIAAAAGIGELTLTGAPLDVLALNQLQITTTSIDISTGISGTVQMQATGGLAPYTWSVDAGTPLPSGLTMNASGLISYDGTQTAATTDVTFTVVDSRGSSATATDSIAVTAPAATVWDAAKIPSTITRTSDTVVTCNAAGQPPYAYSTCAATVAHSVGKWLFAMSSTGNNAIFGAAAVAAGSSDPWNDSQYLGLPGSVGETVGFQTSNMQGYWNSEALGVNSVINRVAFTDYNAWIIAVDLDSNPQTIALYDDTKLLCSVPLPAGARGWGWFPACSMQTAGVKTTLNAGQSAITVPPPLAGLGFVPWNSAQSNTTPVTVSIAPGVLALADEHLVGACGAQLAPTPDALAYSGQPLVEAVGDVAVTVGASHLLLTERALSVTASAPALAIGADAVALNGSALTVTAASASPTVVEKVSVTTGSTAVSSAAGLSATFTNAIQPGDQVVLVFNAKGNAGSSILSASDTAGTAYDVRQPSGAISPYGTLAGALGAPFASALAAGSLTVTVKASKSANLDLTAYLVRGPQLSIDTANIYADALSGAVGKSPAPGTTPYVVGPYNTSGKAFIAMAGLTSFANFSFSSGSGYTVDYNAHTYYYPTFAHKITSAAVSGESFSLTSTSSNTTNKSVLLLPMTY